jgi:hypothetical protein
MPEWKYVTDDYWPEPPASPLIGEGAPSVTGAAASTADSSSGAAQPNATPQPAAGVDATPPLVVVPRIPFWVQHENITWAEAAQMMGDYGLKTLSDHHAALPGTLCVLVALIVLRFFIHLRFRKYVNVVMRPEHIT